MLRRDDTKLGALDVALNGLKSQVESDIVNAKTDSTTWVWGDGTHHPEPEHNVHNITELNWKNGRWTSNDEFVSYHHSDSHH